MGWGRSSYPSKSTRFEPGCGFLVMAQSGKAAHMMGLQVVAPVSEHTDQTEQIRSAAKKHLIELYCAGELTDDELSEELEKLRLIDA